MVTKFSHTTLFVLDQEKAYDFYVKTLGFKVNTDATMDSGYRWLTVNPPEQPDLEVVLMPVLHESMIKSDACPDGFDVESRNACRVLLEKVTTGAGRQYPTVGRAAYEELKSKGVTITEPKEQFYGIECVVKDGCGNWFSMTQPKEMPKDNE